MTKEEASEHSQITASAISSGLPMRPISSCNDLRFAFRCAARKSLHHFCFDIPRTHGIHVNFLTCIIESCSLGKADHTVFAGNVRRRAFDTDDACSGRRVEIEPPPCLSMS